ncbi:hypothetical protein D3C84_1290180 [compost metagenome]
MESLAERDELLLDTFLSGEGDQAFWLQSLQEMVRKCRLFPCVIGSALQDTGVKEFL